jgi:hypothetical protein
MNYGYKEDIIQDDHYLAGMIPAQVLQPGGQWLFNLPKNEVQNRNGVETMNCSNYGTLSALEILCRRKYGITHNFHNFSERYTGVMTGTGRAGNSPHKVIEVIRKYAGVVQESVLPFDDTVKTWEQYYSGVTFGLKLKGVSWLKEWNVQHEWVLNGEVENWREQLKEGLKYSPLGIAVHAWHEEGGKFIRTGTDNHWVVLVGYVEGKRWIVYDSYEKFLKELDWDYGFTRAKRYHIDKRTGYDGQFVVRALQGIIGAYV